MQAVGASVLVACSAGEMLCCSASGGAGAGVGAGANTGGGAVAMGCV
jgi:hypothetical protein